jgi:hypothetical protein
MDLNISLSYNSLVWTQEDGWIKFNADQGFPGPGFRLGFPIVRPWDLHWEKLRFYSLPCWIGCRII